MKEKLITKILTIIAVLVPMAIVPTRIIPNTYTYFLKNVLLLIGGLLLLILILANYKKLEIDLKGEKNDEKEYFFSNKKNLEIIEQKDKEIK